MKVPPATGLFYLIDILIKFHIAVPKKTETRSVVCPDGPEVARDYVLHGAFLIDFLTFLPALLEVTLSFPLLKL